MTSFASLMAMSATHTRESQQAVEHALQERKRKEAQQRKQQAEQEAKERERERKLLLKRLDDKKKEEERQQKLRKEEEARELEAQRQHDSKVNALLYGPKKAAKMSSSSSSGSPKWPSSSTGVKEAVRKRRVDSDDETGTSMLTREEIRQRKNQVEMRRIFAQPKKASHSTGYSKPGKRLPGGALDIVSSDIPVVANNGEKSIKDRLTSMPNTLVRLNKEKRDTRTIDEIVTDLNRARETKVLSGEDAQKFDGWWDKPKKKEPVRKPPAPSSASSTPVSGRNTPQASTPTTQPPPRLSSTAFVSATSTQKKVVPATKPAKPAPPAASPYTSKPSKPQAKPTERPSQYASTKPKPITSSKPSAVSGSSNHRQSTSASTSIHRRKRTRSPSRSESPPPKRHRDGLDMDIQSEIWKLFNKDRSKYVTQDVLSDDEDMEADARILEKEEARSARLAKQEELAAMEEERRHDEEKRRRKKEREKTERRNNL